MKYVSRQSNIACFSYDVQCILDALDAYFHYIPIFIYSRILILNYYCFRDYAIPLIFSLDMNYVRNIIVFTLLITLLLSYLGFVFTALKHSLKFRKTSKLAFLRGISVKDS